MAIKQRLILQCSLAPGDTVLLTAAVRDLHRCYPDRFQTDVDTGFPELWENNPYLTRLPTHAPDVEKVQCELPLINRADRQPHHALHGFVDFLNSHLGLAIELSEFKGDIHLSSEETSRPSPMVDWGVGAAPYWLVCAGGKHDITVKWWSLERYQAVVDHFRGRIQFMQIGRAGDYHPRLQGTIDLRGKTNLRQLIRLVYHAQGVLCGVTALMHLAAAVEAPSEGGGLRPAVIVAGGREPVNWEAYPGHQFIHTIGALPCCSSGGCWKARTFELGDGDDRDRAENLCEAVENRLPRCMALIPAAEVIQRIDRYFTGGALDSLTAPQAEAAARLEVERRDSAFDRLPLQIGTVRIALEQAIKSLPSSPGGFKGRGIVICAGGVKYFTNAWVCVRMLRQWGCTLPVQFWHLGPDELDAQMRSLVEALGVECVDAQAHLEQEPLRMINGWILKPYAILCSSFREVLLLDADNVPLIDPGCLFDTTEYRETGAIFWPDFPRPEPPPRVWRFCGIPFRAESPFESGQIVVDKERCWAPLRLALWFNEHADFFYRHVHGDKETFHLAFRKLDFPFRMPSRTPRPLPGTICQHDFSGRRILQHRNMAKWQLSGDNLRVEGFEHEADCLSYLEDLRQRWNGKIRPSAAKG